MAMRANRVIFTHVLTDGITELRSVDFLKSGKPRVFSSVFSLLEHQPRDAVRGNANKPFVCSNCDRCRKSAICLHYFGLDPLFRLSI